MGWGPILVVLQPGTNGRATFKTNNRVELIVLNTSSHYNRAKTGCKRPGIEAICIAHYP